MRKGIVCLCLLWGLCCDVALANGAAQQNLPPISNRPGATLLLPYFEVDLDDEEGMNTIFSINNASATAVLAHVTSWSDMGIPVFAFNVYLTGYDAQPINLRDILVDGKVPITASAGQDFPQNRYSPQGPLSQDINFASCTGHFPYLAGVDAIYLPYLREALTGGPSSFHEGLCVARNHGTPSIARGYITADTVNACNVMFPSDVSYNAFITYQNVLWGEYYYLNPSQDLAYGDALVSITGEFNGAQYTPGAYTFYGRFNSWLALDKREPLATNLAVRFAAAKDFKTNEKARRRAALPPGTELLVWRDPKTPSVNGFHCGSTPSWYPLGQEQIVAFDEQEQAEIPTFGSPPFPAATQRVTVGNADFPLTAYSGWLYLNLNTTVLGVPTTTDPAAAQAWVTVVHRVQQGPNGGRYDVGFRAIRLDNALNPSHVLIQ
jgi:hypothetical protein